MFVTLLMEVKDFSDWCELCVPSEVPVFCLTEMKIVRTCLLKVLNVW